MNPKPIVVMYIPAYYAQSEWKAEQIMRLLNGNYGEPPEPNDPFTVVQYWTQYYWLCFYKDDISEPELQVFYDKDFTPINFEELKKFITDSIKQDNDG